MEVSGGVPLVTRQRILRRFGQMGILVEFSVEPLWTDSFENESRLEFKSIYGDRIQGGRVPSSAPHSRPERRLTGRMSVAGWLCRGLQILGGISQLGEGLHGMQEITRVSGFGFFPPRTNPPLGLTGLSGSSKE